MTLADLADNWHRFTLAAVEAVLGQPEPATPDPWADIDPAAKAASYDPWAGIVPEAGE